MKHVYAFDSLPESAEHKALLNNFKEKLDGYTQYLNENFELEDPPKEFVWAPVEHAPEIFKDMEIPAYTNNDTIYMSPDRDDWKRVFLNMLSDSGIEDAEDYFDTAVDLQMLTIAGHEITHHIEKFFDDFDDYGEGIWFEEGMCDYLSRKYFLSDEEFKKLHDVELSLVQYYMNEFGDESVESFGSSTYEGSLHYVMFQYWRSFVLVTHLVEEKHEDIDTVFDLYTKWHTAGKKGKLVDYFGVRHLFTQE